MSSITLLRISTHKGSAPIALQLSLLLRADLGGDTCPVVLVFPVWGGGPPPSPAPPDLPTVAMFMLAIAETGVVFTGI